MIQSYIRDQEVRAQWDINDPKIRPLHQSITRGWIETADTVRNQIRRGVTDGGSLHDWLWDHIRQLQEIEGFQDYRGDLVMDAYLEWGVRNYPITDRITQHTLEALERMYNGDPDDMAWDYYLNSVSEIIQYQAGRNRKAPESMTRTEMLRDIESRDDDTLRKMIAAVEYKTQA